MIPSVLPILPANRAEWLLRPIEQWLEDWWVVDQVAVRALRDKEPFWMLKVEAPEGSLPWLGGRDPLTRMLVVPYWSGKVKVSIPDEPWRAVSLRVGFHGASSLTLANRTRYRGSRKARSAARRMKRNGKMMRYSERARKLLSYVLMGTSFFGAYVYLGMKKRAA